jgi:hypothetical protein
MELPSPGVDVAARNGMDMPETEEADEASPLLEKSFSMDDEFGRRSGKRELTRVMISDGQITKNGWTSRVSFGEVTVFAGSKTGLEWVRGCLSLASKLSTWFLTSGMTETG